MGRQTRGRIPNGGKIVRLLGDGNSRKTAFGDIGTHRAPDVPRRRARHFQCVAGQAVIANHIGHAAADILGINFWHLGSVSTPGPAVCVHRRADSNGNYCGQFR